MDERRLGRRSVLAALTGGLTAIAGCSGGSGDGTTTDPGGTTATTTAPGERATPTATPTATSSTPTETTTATTVSRPDLAVEAAETALTDESTPPRVTGAAPGESVTVRTTVTDLQYSEWTAEATFRADDAGVVDLSSRAPESGSYEGVDPMGWLWSATPTGNDGYFSPDVGGGSTTVRIDATAAGTTVTHRMERRYWAEGVLERPIEAEGLVGYLYEPPGEGPHPGVVVLHGSGGRPLRWRGSLLASHGYAAVALQYFGGGDGIPNELREVPLSYVDRAARWFRGRPEVRDGPLGLYGVSRGGELALLVGARFDWPGAVVGYVPSGIVWGGRGGEAPAWSHEGSPVSYLAWDLDDVERSGGPARTRPAFERALAEADAEARREATIAVEGTDAPVAMVSGTDDGVWPSTRLSALAADRLRGAGVDFSFTHDAYEGAGHAILVPYLPPDGRASGSRLVYGGTPAAYADADPGGWALTLETLSAGLR